MSRRPRRDPRASVRETLLGLLLLLPLVSFAGSGCGKKAAGPVAPPAGRVKAGEAPAPVETHGPGPSLGELESGGTDPARIADWLRRCFQGAACTVAVESASRVAEAIAAVDPADLDVELRLRLLGHLADRRSATVVPAMCRFARSIARAEDRISLCATLRSTARALRDAPDAKLALGVEVALACGLGEPAVVDALVTWALTAPHPEQGRPLIEAVVARIPALASIQRQRAMSLEARFSSVVLEMFGQDAEAGRRAGAEALREASVPGPNRAETAIFAALGRIALARGQVPAPTDGLDDATRSARAIVAAADRLRTEDRASAGGHLIRLDPAVARRLWALSTADVRRLAAAHRRCEDPRSDGVLEAIRTQRELGDDLGAHTCAVSAIDAVEDLLLLVSEGVRRGWDRNAFTALRRAESMAEGPARAQVSDAADTVVTAFGDRDVGHAARIVGLLGRDLPEAGCAVARQVDPTRVERAPGAPPRYRVVARVEAVRCASAPPDTATVEAAAAALATLAPGELRIRLAGRLEPVAFGAGLYALSSVLLGEQLAPRVAAADGRTAAPIARHALLSILLGHADTAPLLEQMRASEVLASQPAGGLEGPVAHAVLLRIAASTPAEATQAVDWLDRISRREHPDDSVLGAIRRSGPWVRDLRHGEPRQVAAAVAALTACDRCAVGRYAGALALAERGTRDAEALALRALAGDLWPEADRALWRTATTADGALGGVADRLLDEVTRSPESALALRVAARRLAGHPDDPAAVRAALGCDLRRLELGSPRLDLRRTLAHWLRPEASAEFGRRHPPAALPPWRAPDVVATARILAYVEHGPRPVAFVVGPADAHIIPLDSTPEAIRLAVSAVGRDRGRSLAAHLIAPVLERLRDAAALRVLVDPALGDLPLSGLPITTLDGAATTVGARWTLTPLALTVEGPPEPP